MTPDRYQDADVTLQTSGWYAESQDVLWPETGDRSRDSC
jgi:hypothetical protein